MNFTQIFVIAVLAIPLILVILGRLRMDIAALLIALILGVAQLAGLGIFGKANSPQDAANAVTGFGQPVIITLISLFIITKGFEKSGVTRWIANHIVALGNGSETRLIVLLVSVTAFLSLFMNNLAAGALVLPSAMDVARKTKIKPSKLLIPVAYGSLLGGTATYFTTANIIVSGLLPLAQPPQKALGILEFTPTGGLILLAGILFFAFWGSRLLPDREPAVQSFVSRPTGRELEDYYQLNERLWEVIVRPDSPFIGKSLAESGIGERLGVTVVAIWDKNQVTYLPAASFIFRANQLLMVIGREDRVQQLGEDKLEINKDQEGIQFTGQGMAMVEVLLAPHSKMEGKSLKELGFRSNYGFTAIALMRNQRSYRTDVGDFKLAFGDSLLMIGPEEKIKRLAADSDLITLSPDTSDRPMDGKKAALTTVIILAAIIASILNFPVYLATLAGAILIVLSGVITMEEAYQSIEWQAIFLIAGMYAASEAMIQTGLAGIIGQWMVTLVQPLGSLGLAAGSYLLSALLTQVMGGQVTALVTGPIAISAAIRMSTNAQAIAVATAIGCSASFLTPMAHPVNILMMAPANYTFSDYFKIGWRLTIISFLVLLIGMAVFWGLK